MKKLFLVLAAAAIASGAYAEGYQVNNLSSKQNGMGHVGTAMKLNSESIWFNPAAASFQSTQFDFSVGVTGIASKATYTTLPDYTGKTQSRHFTSDNKIATPLYAYFNYKPLDWMSVGLAFNTPFGSSMNWGDNWAGAQLVQSINLKAYNLQPTVSFKICEHLSVGAGLMMTWGKFDLSRSMLPVGAANAQNVALNNIIQIVAPGTPNIFELAGDRNIMSLGLEGKAKMAVGVNLGIMWDINEQWSLGMTYRSKLKMKVNSGSIDMSTIDDPTIQAVLGQLLPKFDINPSAISSAIVKTELPLPASLTWGVSFRPVPKWEFAVDLQYVLWSAYDQLDVQILNPSTNLPDDPRQRQKLLQHAGIPLRRRIPRTRLADGPHGYVCRRKPRKQRLPQSRNAFDDQTRLHRRRHVPSLQMDARRPGLRLCEFGRSGAHGFLSLRQLRAGAGQRADQERCPRVSDDQRDHRLFRQLHRTRPHVLHRCGVQFLKTEKFTIFAVRLATDAPHCF
jgi:long-chain fatty acid transport protein